MTKINLKNVGRTGEMEVVNLINCPNCDHRLFLLPPGYPIWDIQCSACLWRAQVKSQTSKPTDRVRGAGWDIMSAALKKGDSVPPLITNFKWTKNGIAKREIRLYPFIKRNCLKPRMANIKSVNRLHRMFDYNLKDTKHYVLFSL